MKQKPSFMAAALLLSTTLLHAQYLGGSGDGHDSQRLTTSTLANIFRGGGDDGHSSQRLQASTIANVFRGGPADGFDGQRLTASTLANIFRGGGNDGHGSISVTISTAALGVELVSFKGTWLNDADALLQWEVAKENDLLHYELERSMGGDDGFEPIAVLPPTDSSPSEKTYHFTDYEAAKLGSRHLYYRLKAVDLDGRFTHSAVAVLEVAPSGHTVSIYPNPTARGLTIALSDDLLQGQPLRALLFDPSGRLLRNWDLASTSFEADLGGLSPATYRLVLLQGTVAIHSANIIKQ